MLNYHSSIVSKLTAMRKGRRQFDAFRQILVVLFIMVCGMLSNHAVAVALEWHPTDQISAAAEAFLLNRMGSKGDKTTVRAGNLDARHRLAYCSEPLESFLRRGAKVSARTIVGVRCGGVRPWKVYLPVDVIVTETVLVANRTLPRGHPLTADDVSSERRDVSRLLSGYLSDKRQLLGQRLKTPLIAGTILTPAVMRLDIAVRRGQTVTVTVGGDRFNIKVSGTALMDGALSQRIRVKNNASGRIVEGIVRSREHVEVLVSSTDRFFNADTKVSPNMVDTELSNNDR